MLAFVRHVRCGTSRVNSPPAVNTKATSWPNPAPKPVDPPQLGVVSAVAVAGPARSFPGAVPGEVLEQLIPLIVGEIGEEG